jgi:predicted MFS family arabinose efflux permease
MAVVGDLFADARRGRAMGTVMASFSVASIVGIPAGLFLANKLAWWAPFAAIGGMCVPVWLLVWHLLPSVRGHLHRRHANPWREYREVLFRSSHVRSYALTTLLVMSSFMVVPYLTRHRRFGKHDARRLVVGLLA